MSWQFLFCLSIFCLAFVAAESISDFLENQWKQYKIEFHKNYRSLDEEPRRKGIFVHNFQHINQHNERFVRGEVSYMKKINQFTDMGDNEMPNKLYSPMNSEDQPMYVELPPSFDWRTEKAVTRVKDQQNCGKGDWAFAAIGALEGLLSTRNKTFTELSEQELIDCANANGNYGCDGGTVKKAFDYIKENGISTEQSYPFNGETTTCSNSSNELENKIARGSDIILEIIPDNQESTMRQRLVRNGPILAMIDASLESFGAYKKSDGVYKDEKCSKSGNQNVLIVGYGEETEQKEKYWIVKNSWGKDWGDEGYIKIAREKNNTCGIASNATYIKYANDEVI